MEEDDALLARRWQAGHDAAAAAVVNRYANAVGATAYAVLGNISLAEDVVQETFARAAEHINKLKTPERLAAWLIGIARHIALDKVRKRRRELSIPEYEPIAQDNPARAATLNETCQRLHQALNRLPDDQRELFAMKYIANMNYHGIAKVLGITPDAVGQKLWRIRQKLQQQLKDLC